MDIFEFCIETIKRESEKFNVGINSVTANQLTADMANDVNYDIAHNRCSYMYRRGTISIMFAKECYSKFMTEYKHLLPLFFKWKENPNLTLCSISTGPALDYIALVLCCCQYVMSPSFFKTINVISKYGAWRNTVNIINQIISEGQLLSIPPSTVGNIEVIQGDPFYDFSAKVKERISNSDVVLMSKCLSLKENYPGKEKISGSLMELFHAMKPDAVLFCTDTKPAIGLILSQIAKFPGEFLYEPIHTNTGILIETADFYKNTFGCFPVISARGNFFVWKKSALALSNEILDSKLMKSTKRSFSVNCIAESFKTMSPNLCKSNLRSSNSLNCLASLPLAENFNKPNLPTENLAASRVNSECSVQHSPLHNKNASEIVSPSPVMKTEFQVCDRIKEEEIKSKIPISEKCSSACSVVNKSTEIELDDITENEHARIASLTEKVSMLAVSIKELLQKNMQQNTIEDDSRNHKQETCDTAVDHHCSFQSSTGCHCHTANSYNSYSKCCQKQCMKELCHSRTCQTRPMLCDQNYPISSCGAYLNFSAESMSPTTPKLIIPLNSIPPDILMQIISLLSQTNEKT